MIPYGIARGLINHRIEFSFLDLSIYSFTFRLPEPIEFDCFEINFYCFKEDQYHFLIIDQFNYEIEQQDEYSITYHIEVENSLYIQYVKELMQEYYDYITLKQAGDDHALSKRLISYPEDHYYKSYYDFLKKEVEGKKIWCNNTPIGRVINEWECKELDILDENQKVDYLYLGSQFCFQLLPEIDTIRKMKNQKIVLMLPPVKEKEIDQLERYLNQIKDLNLEIVVNDLGTLILLQKYSFSITLGVLMFKHLKDPRSKYLKRKEKYSYKIDHEILAYYTKNFRVSRFSFECSEYIVELDERFDLYLPYYATNVATYCTMYAGMVKKNRGKQERVDHCPRYCLNQHFMYPSHLHMIGKGNSLLAIDPNVFQKDYIDQFHAGRVVINL